MVTAPGEGRRIAVTGAGGRIGGQVVSILAAEPAHRIVALARRELPGIPTDGRMRTAIADYTQPSALRAALRGVDTLVLVTSDGPVAEVIVHHHNLITAAVDCDVNHIVALSSLDADPESPFCYAVANAYTEQLLRDSGCRLSIARASIYSEFLLGFLNRARTGGELRLPAADGRISLVSRGDVAHCLAALATTPPTGRHHEITGPEALDLPAVALAASRAFRTPITYLPITPAAFHTELLTSGEDPWWAYAYSSMFDSIRQQRWTRTSHEIQRLTGQAPTSLGSVLTQSTPPTSR